MAEEQADRHATLDEVAALAGVSRSVASRVINDAPHVSRAKREAVERAIRKLGYVPNPKARALATRQAGAAALVISRDDPEVLTDPFFAQVIAGVAGGLEEADLHMMLCVAATARGRERVEQLVRSRVVDGVMLMALHEGDPLARIAKESRLPVVFGGRPVDFEPRWYVDIDNVGGARDATNHLLARGRTKVATICGPLDTEVGASRHRGYREAMMLAGLAPLPPEEGDFSEADGAAAMARLLEAHPDLDGVFAANDNMAAGALRALRAAGRPVPEDVAVVGFDDLAVARIADPALTTIRQPIRDLGREMARMLVALIAGRTASPLILPTSLVKRSST
ncbi:MULTISPECIES: LacI family DNA-binding transcriptional regulator [unclassified Streptomyces]|uniref:LacI family DNA-binding transcriptional regulator n=1 Tax=unclassified Streptomyces TaxID=2593676 RepID=UPI002E2DABFA|nr:LacI family DNA-binding transcriptional regulator [Streptomyces sp. NBC_01423]WSX89485.1 LacI family transcriptional regulator [Streptomyces sp. NBC_00891]WSY03964.1 LacI family transcriptional regulator [Streptomyces sp. NBC_00890]WSZ05590.1 LacI family transcriptional regulator [Streptomyces sp. NBC_00869]WSZ26914.1 LacI family transcriptional regulator [Streptomyces sp. NBC_00870]